MKSKPKDQQPTKKTWQKPEIYILDNNNINGGANNAWFEYGKSTGGAVFYVVNGSKTFGKSVNKTAYDNYHS